jgi:AcrR family transcriptional regulator
MANTIPAPRLAREVARAELTRAILASARRQLAEVGATGLSVRAVARDLGMASSAVYRYVSSRDQLLTLLIVEAYDAVGVAAEAADAVAAERGDGPAARWMATCRAVRGWALEHPHEWALVYGSPVTGYAAPQTTVEPATRAARVLASITADALSQGSLEPRPAVGTSAAVADDVAAMITAGADTGRNPDVVARSLLAWVCMVGLVNFELFGHLHNVVGDTAGFFDGAMRLAAEQVGLPGAAA